MADRHAGKGPYVRDSGGGKKPRAGTRTAAGGRSDQAPSPAQRNGSRADGTAYSVSHQPQLPPKEAGRDLPRSATADYVPASSSQKPKEEECQWLPPTHQARSFRRTAPLSALSSTGLATASLRGPGLHRATIGVTTTPRSAPGSTCRSRTALRYRSAGSAGRRHQRRLLGISCSRVVAEFHDDGLPKRISARGSNSSSWGHDPSSRTGEETSERR